MGDLVGAVNWGVVGGDLGCRCSWFLYQVLEFVYTKLQNNLRNQKYTVNA